MIPMNVPVQGLKTLVKRGGSPDDAAHEAMLLEPMGHGRVCHLPLTIGSGSMARCSASYACPRPLTSFFAP
jgi:hypothetical protein